MTSIVINGWQKGLTFDCAHIIPHHDKCGRLHGHTYSVILTVEGPLDDEGMVADFGVVKRAVKDIIKDWDHRVLVPRRDPQVKVTEEGVELRYGRSFYRFPLCDCALLDVSTITVEHLTEVLADTLLTRKCLPPTVEGFTVEVCEGPGQGARTYRRHSESPLGDK